MLWWIYEIFFWTALFIASPYYLFRMRRRGGYVKGFIERFGFFKRTQWHHSREDRPIWVHAVSVGEVDIALRLIHKFQEASNVGFVLSTTTSTGHALAARKLPSNVSLFYYPLDSRFCFKRTHHLLSPRAFILIEAELWPNHLSFCAEKRIPLILVNARLSEHFYPRYRKFQWLFNTAFHGFRLVTLQSEKDRDRLLRLGFSSKALTWIGSLKYDTAKVIDESSRSRLLADLAFFGDQPFLVAGSTHRGEEEIILKIFLRLQSKYPDLVLVLVPRHAERSVEISAMLKEYGVHYVLRSELNSNSASSIRRANVLLLNTTGELKYLYERATVIFIGKSLMGHGGQNMIEPAACGKPVIFGPHMENFQSIAEDFLAAEAAIQIQNPTELEVQITSLLQNSEQRKLLGEKAVQLVQSKQGGMDRTIRAIQKVLEQPFNRLN